MDKDRKLRRYRRKDYSQVVAFPVEIVGRDGIVRRYSFENSVRLYHRRILNAALRYEDQEIVCAEIAHCQQRIAQLRRSYLEHYAWDQLELPTGGDALPQALGAEAVAFLRRCAESSDCDVQQVSLQLLAREGQLATFYVSGFRGSSRLLYVYALDALGDCGEREKFFVQLKRLAAAGSAAGVEHLVSFHHTGDCGLVLTSTEALTVEPPEIPESLEELTLMRPSDGAAENDTYKIGLAAFQASRAEEALKRFDQLLSEQPDHRGAALAASVAAEMIDRHELAVFYGKLGARHYPHDPFVSQQLAFALFRGGEFEEAVQVARESVAVQNGLHTARFVLALTAIHGKQLGRAEQELRKLDDSALANGGDLRRFGALMLRALIWRRSAIAVCLMGLVLSIIGMVAGVSWFSATLLSAFGIGALGWLYGVWLFARFPTGMLYGSIRAHALRAASDNSTSGREPKGAH